ncbi:hypothetical protein [Leucobacter chironomi]|uniref:hypothetical protein n=1 Tax=Leucobacter chironomi TaxID=491918 RepID=UPI000414EB89|nr:hypothetical protein [Leucobacter chironomi]
MTTPEMRILTVRQPWAWAIIHGGKDVENRARNLAGDYRGPVAIHAGAVYDRSADEHPEIRRMADARGASSMREFLIPYGHLAYRHIAGVVNLVDVHMATPDSLGRIRCQPEDRAPGEWRPACSP